MLDVPASRLEPALALFAEAVTEPALADDDVDRHVQLRLAEIEQAQANSAQLASMAFRRGGLRPDRPGVADDRRASRSTVAAVGAGRGPGLPRRALRAARDDADPGRRLPRRDPVDLAERAFGGWQVAAAAAGRARSRPRPRRARAIVVDRPGSVQADVRLGGFGIDRRHPAWADITVASYAMGGAFLSRLNAVLREEKGYTYGVRLGLLARFAAAGSYALQGSFRTDVVVDATRTARELLDISGRPFTAEEVADAVAFFVGVSPLRYATADGVADQAASTRAGRSGRRLRRPQPGRAGCRHPGSATAAYESLVHRDELTLVSSATPSGWPSRSATSASSTSQVVQTY